MNAYPSKRTMPAILPLLILLLAAAPLAAQQSSDAGKDSIPKWTQSRSGAFLNRARAIQSVTFSVAI
jgi:hypothetical protein